MTALLNVHQEIFVTPLVHHFGSQENEKGPAGVLGSGYARGCTLFHSLGPSV